MPTIVIVTRNWRETKCGKRFRERVIRKGDELFYV